MRNGGSIITLSFEASQKVYPGYNIMGTAKAALENCVKQLANEYGKNNIRVNAISAGPLPTLAARSINGFNEMRKAHAERSPLKGISLTKRLQMLQVLCLVIYLQE